MHLQLEFSVDFKIYFLPLSHYAAVNNIIRNTNSSSCGTFYHQVCKSTPGDTIDVIVTQRGIAVNPKRKELKEKLIKAGLPVKEITELKEIAEKITGVPKKVELGNRVVANVLYRDGTLLDTIKNTL